jgi:hypothetical protein
MNEHLTALFPDLRDGEPKADFARKEVGYFGMSRYRFLLAVLRVEPNGVPSAFTLQNTAMKA